MTEEHDRILEDLAAYTLGSLGAADRARLEGHVRSCPACSSRLEEYRAVIGVLPLALTPTTPPSAAWRAIRSAVRARRARARGPALVLADWLRIGRWPALAAVIAGLVVWNVTLQREITRRAPGPAPGPEVEALSRRPGRVVILKGTGRPEASARIFVAVDGGGHLAVSGLSVPPPRRVYQLWFLRSEGAALSGATFGVDPTGRAWAKVTVPAPFDEVRAIVITEEPAPGSALPTGPPLLAD